MAWLESESTGLITTELLDGPELGRGTRVHRDPSLTFRGWGFPWAAHAPRAHWRPRWIENYGGCSEERLRWRESCKPPQPTSRSASPSRQELNGCCAKKPLEYGKRPVTSKPIQGGKAIC
jgi:hypothetical protein